MEWDRDTPAVGTSVRFGVWMKWTLTIAIVAFVAFRARNLLDGADFSDLSVSPGWLILSGVCYAVGWFPSIWFWRGLMTSLDQSPGWVLCGKAYFAGHLGKYIPGKAGVLLLRSGVLAERGYAFGVGVITSAYETLIVMGVGLLVAAALGPMLVPDSLLAEWSSLWGSWLLIRWLPGGVLLFAALLTVPWIARLLTFVAFKLTPREARKAAIDARHLLRGYLVFIGCWSLLGLSLGAALQSITTAPFSLSAWPLWTAAVSASTVIGFFAIFTPGGLGVRESILMEILRFQPGVTTQQAVLGSVLLRIVWLATEAGMYAICWLLDRRGRAADGKFESGESPVKR